MHECLTRYSHSNWAREQRAEPLCRAVAMYLQLSCLVPLPIDIFKPVGTRAAPANEVLEHGRKGRLFITDSGEVLLVRCHTPPPAAHLATATGRYARLLGDEPTRIYVPLIRTCVMDGCHADMSCHQGTTRTLQCWERYYWWVGMEASTKFWVRRCFKCTQKFSPNYSLAHHSPTAPEWPRIVRVLRLLRPSSDNESWQQPHPALHGAG